MRAFCLIRPQPFYRRDAFISGLRAAGHEVITGEPTNPDADTLLVIWNRYGTWDQLATKVEKVGGTCLIAENAYVKGRHEGGSYYALARHAHNGRGQWTVGGPERWDALGIELKPLRSDGDHILIAPNRPFGMTGGVMPGDWAEKEAQRLQAITKRPIRIRPHPANDVPRTSLDDDLLNAWAVIIWSSSVGVRALINGIPTICYAPWWIAKRGALSSWRQLEVLDHDNPNTGAERWERMRLEALCRLAWAQFSVEEIASGEPFNLLLRRTEQKEISASA